MGARTVLGNVTRSCLHQANYHHNSKGSASTYCTIFRNNSNNNEFLNHVYDSHQDAGVMMLYLKSYWIFLHQNDLTASILEREMTYKLTRKHFLHASLAVISRQRSSSPAFVLISKRKNRTHHDIWRANFIKQIEHERRTRINKKNKTIDAFWKSSSKKFQTSKWTHTLQS